ncbi:golgin subfamily A member 6-like protein 4 [Sabethes cyaneus]|uniref:golgin subfamily A member 6-like protein 4 n=1 Tax=Sabethes cyaneus TaxID=53552 RepID=UPI00237EBFDC|nr:golgin subfamily A member 6-like protein 4 [Sabethes cyaneus]
MSDSDDTDVLLLIPPDYFNKVEGTVANQAVQYCAVDFPSYSEFSRLSDLHNSSRSMSYAASNNESQSGIQSYRSTIATTATNGNGGFNNAMGGYGFQNFYSSTPLKGPLDVPSKLQLPGNNQNVLSEIDQFLKVSSNSNTIRAPVELEKSPDNSIIDMNNVSLREIPSLTASDFNSFNKATVPQKPPRKDPPAPSVVSKLSSISSRTPLLSLSEIWNSNVINQESSKVQEERLRRQHCERNIQALQGKILEYEQKIAVAIDVDKEKEGIILKLEDNAIRLERRVRELEQTHAESHEKLLQENLEIKNKNLFLEKELSDTIAAIRQLRDKNETLVSKIESVTTANQDVADVHKNQLKDLEIRLSNSKESERSLKEQLTRLKKSNDQLKDEFEVERKKTEECNKLRADFASLKVKSDNLSRKLNESNAQNESYRTQIQDLKTESSTHLEEKRNLLKELDVQRLSLKKYYQSQLEDVVSDKLKEFQKELKSVEEQLRDEAKRKERLLAERAIKQIELINQTNEQEIKLLNEKYYEQESLYRLQLANSSKTIHELESKLASYQNRRADIAEQLHTIMEAQWQKALEVLTSPSSAAFDQSGQQTQSRFSKLCVDHIDKDQLDGVKTLKSVAENEIFQTPISSRQQKSGDRSSLPKDLLHNYIELLLEKSPNDLQGLEKLLAAESRKESKECKERPSMLPAGKPQTLEFSSTGNVSRTIGKTPRPWR